jgi:hypothetical protein
LNNIDSFCYREAVPGAGPWIGSPDSCAASPHKEITMKDFLKNAYFAIEFMNQHHPELKVGIESEGIPDIKYLDYNQEQDKMPPKQDTDDCKNIQRKN